EVQAAISAAKNQLLDPHTFEQSSRHPAVGLVAAVWAAYEEELRRSNAWDFDDLLDRKSTRLNSSHSQISYAVFCLKKKNAYGVLTYSYGVVVIAKERVLGFSRLELTGAFSVVLGDWVIAGWSDVIAIDTYSRRTLL